MTTDNEDNVRAALVAATTAALPLSFTRFARASATHGGRGETLPWSEWLQRRVAAAAMPWPTADDLERRCNEVEAGTYGDPGTDWWAAAVKSAKLGLPVEVGAVLVDGRRSDDAVALVTWLFVDVDGVEDVEGVRRLHRLLADAGVNHLVAESPTSRMRLEDGSSKQLRVHLYVQLAPVVLPSSATVPRREVKEWWRRVYAASAGALTGAAGLDFDRSVDDLSQPAFISYVPDGAAGRKMQFQTDGQALDLERFVAALGHDATRPAPPKGDAAATATAKRGQSGRQAARPSDSGEATPVRPAGAAAAAGATEGHTTGSLIMQAAEHFHLLDDANGRRHCVDRARGMWAIRCPWAASHKSDPRQILGVLDSSTVVFDNVTDHGEDGGFRCMHNGSGADGECTRATAADVLSWARRKNCPLPDRPGFSGAGRAVVDADAEMRGEESTASAPASPPSSPPKPTARQRDARPKIVVRVNDVAGMRDAAVAALASRGDVFVQNGQLVDLAPSGPRPIPADHLLAILGEVARWVSHSRDEEGNVTEKPARVPRDVVGAIMKAPRWPGIAELRAVVRHPPLLPDGRLVTSPGYDAESKLLYLPDADFNVPARPGREDAVAARDRLLAFVRNTAFCDPGGSSVWLGFLLTLAARTAVPTTPIFGFDAAVAGAGKTSLVKVAFGLVHGELPQLGAPVVDDDAEAEKRLPTWARMPLVVWDNVKHTFGSPVVDGAITAGKATTRRLGGNESMSFDLTSTSWAMTGNNLSVGEDGASRCIIARIKAPTSRRYDFAVDDVAFYAAQRPAAVADALTILRAFIAAGSPQKDNVPYCRFVEWSRLVRQALLWLGMPDPVGGEVVDSAAEVKAGAIRSIAAWRPGIMSDEDRKLYVAGSGKHAATAPFHAADLDTSFMRSRDEDEETFRRRRAVVDALSAFYGRKVEGAAKVGNALQKLRDAMTTMRDGRTCRFVVDRVGAKSVYGLEVESVESA